MGSPYRFTSNLCQLLVTRLIRTAVERNRLSSPMLLTNHMTNHYSSQFASQTYGLINLCCSSRISERYVARKSKYHLLYRKHYLFAGGEGTGGRKEMSSTSSPSAVTPNNPTLPPRPPQRGQKPIRKVTNYVFAKFLSFVQGYHSLMEKRFPQVMQVYRVFVIGFKDFSKELAEYVKIKTKVLLSPQGVLNLNKNELDVYYRMPSEIFRVGPTLILSALPGFQYIIFPVAYKFPKTLLSSHFWSLQQKAEFAIDSQRKRLFNQRPVFRHLQSNLDTVFEEDLRNICREILFKLGSGSQPTLKEIMKIKPLFESHPFGIKYMHGPHIKSLCRLHGIHTGFFKRKRLYDRAEMLYVMDIALIRQGILNLKVDDLKTACFLRGLNAANTRDEDMVEFLQQWASVSSSIQPHSYSLLLHLPVLLAYNNPNNWALLA